jgi:hypothetical protein
VVTVTRLSLFAIALAASAAVAAPSFAQTVSQAAMPETVAGAFIAAAQAQDRQAVMQLLDEKVSIRFPARAQGEGHGEGQPFVIGYLDGLFYGQRAVSLDGGSAPRDGAIRFMAHDARSHDRYAIDIEVRNAHVVRVTVNREPGPEAGQAVASLNPL